MVIYNLYKIQLISKIEKKILVLFNFEQERQRSDFIVSEKHRFAQLIGPFLVCDLVPIKKPCFKSQLNFMKA